jgi:predicted nicotinamide N-methyase
MTSQFGIPVKSIVDRIKIKEIELLYHRITNIDELYQQLVSMDAQTEDVIDERIPYWAELWPSALALSEFIIANQSILPDQALIHEMGCGLGIPSVVCGSLGFKVVMSDYVEAPLHFAAKNWELNLPSRPHTIILDWRNIPDDMNKCDVLLAADIVYERRMFPIVINAFKRLLNEEGIIIFAEPGRSFAKEFFELLVKNQFNVEQTQHPIRQNNISFAINVSVVSRLKLK